MSNNGSPVRHVAWPIRMLGSLWFAAITLMLALVAMAAATVYESQRSPQHALDAFYYSRWFAWLLGLMTMSVVAVLVIRLPFKRRQIGFLLTHASIILVLAGALVTKYRGIEGTLELEEGQTRQEFDLRQDAIIVAQGAQRVDAPINVPRGVLTRQEPVELGAPPLTFGPLTVTVDQYLAHSRWDRNVVNDSPLEQPAVEVTLTGPSGSMTDWVFADQSTELGIMDVAFSRVRGAKAWEAALSSAPAEDGGAGSVKISYLGKSYELPLDACMEQAAAVGESGLTVRVWQYLPHAVVGPEGKVASASDQPVNPAIDVEVTSAGGRERRFAFAKFPDFRHAASPIDGLDLTFVGPTATASSAPIQILANDDGEMVARFRGGVGAVLTQRIDEGVEMETPFPQVRLRVLRRFENARIDWQLVADDPAVERRTPAVRATIAGAGEPRVVWLQQYRPWSETFGGRRYDFLFGSGVVPLDFNVTLNSFRIGRYPGTMQPRSFESTITIHDPAAGADRTEKVSMNHPVKHGGYTFFQSSYRERGGKSVTYLSVSRDPGQPIVFAGYILMLAGMVWVLVIRIGDRRRSAAATVQTQVKRTTRARRERELVHAR